MLGCIGGFVIPQQVFWSWIQGCVRYAVARSFSKFRKVSVQSYLYQASFFPRRAKTLVKKGWKPSDLYSNMVFLLSRVHYKWQLSVKKCNHARPCWYQEKRSTLFEYLNKEYRISVNRMASDDVFLLLIDPPSKNKSVQKLIAKYVFDCYEKRRSLVLYVNIDYSSTSVQFVLWF